MQQKANKENRKLKEKIKKYNLTVNSDQITRKEEKEREKQIQAEIKKKEALVRKAFKQTKRNISDSNNTLFKNLLDEVIKEYEKEEEQKQNIINELLSK